MRTRCDDEEEDEGVIGVRMMTTTTTMMMDDDDDDVCVTDVWGVMCARARRLEMGFGARAFGCTARRDERRQSFGVCKRSGICAEGC
jgi:hypothetical protein